MRIIKRISAHQTSPVYRSSSSVIFGDDNRRAREWIERHQHVKDMPPASKTHATSMVGTKRHQHGREQYPSSYT
jgi:hypothetical protein